MTESTRRIRNWLKWGLGVLWFVDGLLQLQPGMFSMDMISQVMQPALSGQPSWLTHMGNWAIALISPHIALINWGFAGIQLLIGILILMRNPRWVKFGLWLSIVWGVAVWIFGEGLGSILTGSATALSGAPGSVILYVWLAVLLLIPDASWCLDKARCWMRDGVVYLWWLAALQQAIPAYWTPLGLSSVFQSNLMMQPHWFVKVLSPVVNFSAKNPHLLNGILVLGMISVGILLLYRGRWTFWGFWIGTALLLFMWIFGQGFGGVFSGMGTDPNAAPLWFMLMLPSYMTRQFPQLRVKTEQIA
ncbi:MAG: hypothetical protein ACYCT0_05695 [Sulfobacillus sp.]